MPKDVKPIYLLLLRNSAIDTNLALSLLREAGLVLDVTPAGNRAEFEQALSARAYHLILADYVVPDFSGMAALALVRKRLSHIPFIFMSAQLGEEAAIEAIQHGATDYVLKHRMERLLPAVRRALRKAREQTHTHNDAILRSSELRFCQVMDAVPLLIWTAAPDGQLLYSNKVWKDHMPYGMEYWLAPERIHPEDYPACEAAWEYARAHMEPFSLEVRLLSQRDRTHRWHLLRLAPIEAAPGTEPQTNPNWLGIATDVQDGKLNEEALRTAEKLSVTGRMAATVAHEINNPLESLTNLLFLIQMECTDNPAALAYLKTSEEELERISVITRQTLQFYRDPSMPVDVDARQIVEDVVQLFHGRLAAGGIQAALHVEPGILFQAIQGEIRQVLINLIGNAIDAVGAKGRIDVEANHMEWEGQRGVQLQVHDNGPGITAEQAQRLFTPFFSTKGARGTGLGLWVSKGIVEKHGGTLHLVTGNANGSRRTTATVILPRTVSVGMHSLERSAS